MNFLSHCKMAAECEKFLELSSEEIEAIISEATPTNTKRATAWGVSLFKGEFLLFFCVVYTVKGDQKRTEIEIFLL